MSVICTVLEEKLIPTAQNTQRGVRVGTSKNRQWMMEKEGWSSPPKYVCQPWLQGKPLSSAGFHTDLAARKWDTVGESWIHCKAALRVGTGRRWGVGTWWPDGFGLEFKLWPSWLWVAFSPWASVFYLKNGDSTCFIFLTHTCYGGLLHASIMQNTLHKLSYYFLFFEFF